MFLAFLWRILDEREMISPEGYGTTLRGSWLFGLPPTKWRIHKASWSDALTSSAVSQCKAAVAVLPPNVRAPHPASKGWAQGAYFDSFYPQPDQFWPFGKDAKILQGWWQKETTKRVCLFLLAFYLIQNHKRRTNSCRLQELCSLFALCLHECSLSLPISCLMTL